MRTSRRWWKMSLALGALGLGAFAADGIGEAATWCVPNASIGGACPKVSATVQGAIDTAASGDTIKVGTGNPAERLAITKRVKILCQGAVLRDEGLKPGSALIAYSGTYSALPIDACTIEVSASDVGIAVPSTVAWFNLKNSTLTRIGERAGTGLSVDGALRAWVVRSTISGFEVGGLFDHARWMNPEPATWISNGIGLWQINTQGQTFYNRFEGNDVGLRHDGIPLGGAWTGAHDINGNTFEGNGVAVQWGLGAKNTEFNHNDLRGNGVAFRVETEPGAFVESDTAYTSAQFVEGDTAYTSAQGCSEQFGDVEVDGVTYHKAAFSTPSC